METTKRWGGFLWRREASTTGLSKIFRRVLTSILSHALWQGVLWDVGWKGSPLGQGLGYAEFRTSTVSRSKHTRSMSGSRRIPYQRFVTVPLSMPRIGVRLWSNCFGGYGADLGIAPRTEDLIRENLNNLITMTIVMAATTVAVRMFRFIHHYGNIMIADGRVGDQ